VNRLRRQVGAAVNPVSTAATRWWCQSALRHWLTGYGPTAAQRRIMKAQTQAIGPRSARAGSTPSAEQMQARAQAVDDLLGPGDH
jgi:hypothetical protein